MKNLLSQSCLKHICVRSTTTFFWKKIPRIRYSVETTVRTYNKFIYPSILLSQSQVFPMPEGVTVPL